MEIKRSGPQPAQQPAGEHFTGTVRIDRSALALVCCLAFFGAASCAGAERQTKFIEGQEAVRASTVELRLEVVELARMASAHVEQAADAIRSESDSEDFDREALLWKVNAIPQIQAAALQPDPLVAALDLWAFILQMRNYYATGAGAAALGPHASVARSAIAKMEARVLVAAGRVSTAGGKNARGRLEKWANENPITSSNFARDGLTAEYAYILREGQKGGVGAIDEAQATMQRLEYRLALASEFMPKQMRWNAELATGDVLAVDEIKLTMANMNATLLDASKLLVTTPEMIRLEREAAMQSVKEERIAALVAVDKQRQLVLEAVAQEREQALRKVDQLREGVMKDADAMASRQLKAVVDYVLLRLAQVAGALALLAGLFWLLRRLTGKSGPRPATPHLGEHAPAQ